jgi:hypothetical protein
MGALRMRHEIQLHSLQPVPNPCGAALRTTPARLCIIVCGMHRSGTSALTRVVNLLGADIAGDLIPAHSENIRGYWESAAVIRIHDDLLNAIGCAKDDPLDPISFLAGWDSSRAAQCAKRRIANLIARDFAGSSSFVVKDPRVSRFLSLWIDVLEDMYIEPIILIPFRNPLEVAASLAQRAAVPLSKALLLYFHSYLETELASRKVPRLFIQYNELLRDWRSCQNRISELAGERLPSPPAATSAKIDQFLTNDLRHHRFSREQLANHPGVSTDLVEMFDRMSEAAETGDDRRLREALDCFRAIHEQVGVLYRGLVVSEREQANAQREALREAFERSTSWRTTAPLRWIREKAARRGSARTVNSPHSERLRERGLASNLRRKINGFFEP